MGSVYYVKKLGTEGTEQIKKKRMTVVKKECKRPPTKMTKRLAQRERNGIRNRVVQGFVVWDKMTKCSWICTKLAQALRLEQGVNKSYLWKFCTVNIEVSLQQQVNTEDVMYERVFYYYRRNILRPILSVTSLGFFG